jgi:hypothetical protein
MPMLADDQMIMNRDFEGFSNGDNLMGKMNVVGRRLRIARGMIMHQNIPCLPESSGDVRNFENNHINSMSCGFTLAKVFHFHPSQMRVSLRVFQSGYTHYGSLRYPHSQRQAF